MNTPDLNKLSTEIAEDAEATKKWQNEQRKEHRQRLKLECLRLA